MFNFLKLLFGRKTPGDNIVNRPRLKSSVEVAKDVTCAGLNYDEHQKKDQGASSNSNIKLFWTIESQMDEAMARHDVELAARYIRKYLDLLLDFVKELTKERDFSMIPHLYALDIGGKVLALLGDDEGLAKMRKLVQSFPEPNRWVKVIEIHHQDRIIFGNIMEAVRKHPGCFQADVKNFIGIEDGHRVANLIHYLVKFGKISKIKTGSTNRLFITGSSAHSVLPPKRKVGSHRKDRNPLKIKDLDISSLSYIPLPRSPAVWEECKDAERPNLLEPINPFEVQGADWRITSVEKFIKSDRPDTAFRKSYPIDTGLLMIDDLGKACGLGLIEAAALRYDRSGNLVVKDRLLHSVYRLGVHPCGSGFIAMSKECVAHAYDDSLKLIFETSLSDTPEIQAIKMRYNVKDRELRRYIRCVALSQTSSRYLVTAVDEAFCMDINGTALWCVRLPIKEGWERIAPPVNRYGTSSEVQKALTLMNLSLPISPEILKLRYRELAKQWHPDLNPSDLDANNKMKTLNSAVELLTGIDVSTSSYYTDSYFVKTSSRKEINVSGVKCEISIAMPELQVKDWIYAANFTAKSDSIYLAGYSGRVIMVDQNGEGVRVYDIGNTPHRIVDTGEYLYLLTRTRLYVLKEDTLHALIDTYEGGDLVFAQNGFGLLESKRFRWFSKEGIYLGGIISKDPIRRVYTKENKMLVETRLRHAIIEGAPKWWT